MPTLLEMQTAMQKSIVYRDNDAVSVMLAEHVSSDRLDIYRNTFLFGLTKALQLCFPVVRKLVGDDFFEATAQLFIAEHPPRVAWLDRYGGELPEFLSSFPPAATIPYLGDVATLEWAVNCALHATDTERLDLTKLDAIRSEDQAHICFAANPSIQLLHLACPADEIWRAILAEDNDALGTIDIDAGSVHLLVERNIAGAGVEVERLSPTAWQLLSDLCAGRSIEAVIEAAGDLDVSAALAEHLALGRFTGFALLQHSVVPIEPTAGRG
ncbi:hypothetical protein V1281_000636 [Nitrobacteraceae bacterium AZCC 2161]